MRIDQPMMLSPEQIRFAEVQNKQKVDGTKRNYYNKVYLFAAWLNSKGFTELTKSVGNGKFEPILPYNDDITKSFFGHIAGESLAVDVIEATVTNEDEVDDVDDVDEVDEVVEVVGETVDTEKSGKVIYIYVYILYISLIILKD